MALLFVLWLVVILCAVALEMQFSSHLRVQVTANTGDSTRAFYLARAGVERAVADLDDSKDMVQAEADLLEGAGRDYRNVELGDGTYTLYAGLDTGGDPLYGIVDEAARLNVNNASAETLTVVPGLGLDLARAVVAQREQEPFHDLDDLLLVQGIDALALRGEDQNGNGLLDPSENDGDESWPPDNGDGALDIGLTGYLTAWSASRNVAADGSERVNLKTASAEDIVAAVSGISEQQADSIVAHRDNKGGFSSVADLLDVELVEKVAQQQQQQQQQRQPQPQDRGRNGQNGRNGGNSSNGGNAGQNQGDGSNADASSGDNQQNGRDQQQPNGQPEQQPQQPEGEQQPPQEQKPEVVTKGTGKKAFEKSDLQRIADYFTTVDEEVLQGRVNVNTAPETLLALLPGLDEALAQAIVSERQGRPEGFTTEVDLLDVDGVTPEVFAKVCGLISVRSDVFSVRSFGVLKNGEVSRCAYAVIDRTEDTIHLRYWREIDW